MSDKEQAAKAKDPSTVSMAYAAMLPQWNKLTAVLAGTNAMREAGEEYLPMHPAESEAAYSERLEATTLFNLTDLTLKSWVGRPFSDPMKINEDVPEEISMLLKDDIDLQGNNADVFARRWFEEGLAKAFCHVLVEFPRKKKAKKGEKRTLNDDRVENLRPYWVLVKPENLIFAHAEIVNGAEQLTHVRIMEKHVEQDGFAEKVSMRIRVLEPGLVTIFEKRKKGKSKKEQWQQIEQWKIDLDCIPLVTFYANREGFMMGKSPLLDLADVNVSHWQSTSDQRSVLTVARFPILACSGGVDNGKTLKVGPNQWLYTSDPQGRFYYVEHTGAAIAAGRQDLADLESQMANYGAEFLRQRPGNPTATARALDSAESTSPLQDVTIRFMDAVAVALKYTAKWLKLQQEGGTITLPTDFGPEQALIEDYRALIEARKNRDISRERFTTELQRRGTLADDFDPKKNAEELEKEVGDLTGSPVDALPIDPDAEE